jgi:hypothetical protein
LIDLERVTQKVIEIIKMSTDVKVKAGWITQEDTFPIVTVYALGQRPEKILAPSAAIYRFTYQIDVWHHSMLECDRAAKGIIDRFIDIYKGENWFGLNFIISDLQEEGIFRKAIRVEFGAIG